MFKKLESNPSTPNLYRRFYVDKIVSGRSFGVRVEIYNHDDIQWKSVCWIESVDGKKTTDKDKDLGKKISSYHEKKDYSVFKLESLAEKIATSALDPFE